MNISLTHPVDEFNFNNIHFDESKMSARKIPEIFYMSASEAKWDERNAFAFTLQLHLSADEDTKQIANNLKSD